MARIYPAFIMLPNGDARPLAYLAQAEGISIILVCARVDLDRPGPRRVSFETTWALDTLALVLFWV